MSQHDAALSPVRGRPAVSGLQAQKSLATHQAAQSPGEELTEKSIFLKYQTGSRLTAVT